MYRVDEKKLIIFQLRSGILPGQVANYFEIGKNSQIIKFISIKVSALGVKLKKNFQKSNENFQKLILFSSSLFQ